MKQETLNKKLIERLKHYGMKYCEWNTWTYNLWNNSTFIVLLFDSNDIIIEKVCTEQGRGIIASGYKCRNVKDLDYLLTQTPLSPFQLDLPDNYKQQLKELNK